MTLTQYARQFALLIRLPNSFTVISNVVAATFIASSGVFNTNVFTIVVCASLCLYHGGMILNDCLDIAEDKKTQPHRPLASGAISLKVGWGMGSGLLVLGVLLLASLGAYTFFTGLALLACIIGYNMSPRESLYGCVLMGLCRTLNWLLPLVAMNVAGTYFHYALLVGIYVMSLTFFSRDEEYANKKWLAVLAVAGLLLGCGYFVFRLDSSASLYWVNIAAILVCLCIALFKVVKLLKRYEPQNIRAIVMFFILGMIPLDAVMVFVAGHHWQAILILCLIIPGKYLARRLYVT